MNKEETRIKYTVANKRTTVDFLKTKYAKSGIICSACMPKK
jgi:hypothetical protein